MSALVVDTSTWVDYFDGVSQPDLDQALRESRVFLPPIVAAELLSGQLRPDEEKGLTELLATLPLCQTPLDHWIRVGRLRATLSAKGFQISTPDAHVAQCALDIGAHLLTRDRVFNRISEITGLVLSG